MGDFLGPHNVKTSNKFFDKMNDHARIIVGQESFKMATSMVYILKHRQTFKIVGGQSPRWDPAPRHRPLSKRSFDKWAIQQRKDGEYWIGNNAEAMNGHNYMRNLVTGKGWSEAILRGKHKKLVRGPNGGLFSTQMPQGLDPWKAVKRQDLINNIAKRFFKELL